MLKTTDHCPRRLALFATVLLVLSAACAPQPQATLTVTTANPATATAAAGPTSTASQTTTPTSGQPTPTATVSPIPSPYAGNDRLLVNTYQGLWMAKPDWSDAILLIDRLANVTGPLADAVSSTGGNIAYFTTSDSAGESGEYRNLTLNILSLYSRKRFLSLPLTSPDTEPWSKPTLEPMDDAFIILEAILQKPSYAWSPDGRRLAFIGAQEGLSADLYEYIHGSGAVVRLTDGPDQAYRPLWSPDGKWIVHDAAKSFGSGAGYNITGFFAASADGSGAISLYDIPEFSGDERGVGWLDDLTLVSYTWHGGARDLRLVDLSAEKTDLVFSSRLTAIAAAPGRGSLLFAESLNDAAFDDNPRPGLFLITAAERSPRRISDTDILEIGWAEGAGAFLARTRNSQLLEISPAGEIRNLGATAIRIPVVSPGGLAWAYAGVQEYDRVSGVFVGAYGAEPARIFDGDVFRDQILFSPDGDSLYFITSSYDLYRAQAPDWSPIKLAEGMLPASGDLSMAWLEGE